MDGCAISNKCHSNNSYKNKHTVPLIIFGLKALKEGSTHCKTKKTLFKHVLLLTWTKSLNKLWKPISIIPCLVFISLCLNLETVLKGTYRCNFVFSELPVFNQLCEHSCAKCVVWAAILPHEAASFPAIPVGNVCVQSHGNDLVRVICGYVTKVARLNLNVQLICYPSLLRV